MHSTVDIAEAREVVAVDFIEQLPLAVEKFLVKLYDSIFHKNEACVLYV